MIADYVIPLQSLPRIGIRKKVIQITEYILIMTELMSKFFHNYNYFLQVDSQALRAMAFEIRQATSA